MPSLSISSATSSGFNWKITGLSSQWDWAYYNRAYIVVKTTSDVNVLTSAEKYPTNNGTFDTELYTQSLSTPGTYMVYAYVTAKNNVDYPAGQGQVTIPSSSGGGGGTTPPPSPTNDPTPGAMVNIGANVHGKDVTVGFNVGDYTQYVYIRYSWSTQPAGVADASITIQNYPSGGAPYDMPKATAPAYNTAYSYTIWGRNKTGQDGTKYTKNFTTDPDITKVTATRGSSGLLIDASWTAITGATGYRVWLSPGDGTGDWDRGTTASTSMTDISASKEYWNYTIKVVPYNGSGDMTASAGQGTVTTRDMTDPGVNFLRVDSVTTSTITVTAEGYDVTPTNGNMSGLSGFYFYIKQGTGSWSSATTVYKNASNQGSYTFQGLTEGIAYTVGVRALDNDSRTSTLVTQPATTSSNKPTSGFDWTNGTYNSATGKTDKVAGSTFNLTATEWTNLQTKVNQYRSWKKLSAYPFTSVSSGTTFEAFLFNQVRNAINDMSPPTAVPATKSTDDDVLASDLNRLRDSLNSL